MSRKTLCQYFCSRFRILFLILQSFLPGAAHLMKLDLMCERNEISNIFNKFNLIFSRTEKLAPTSFKMPTYAVALPRHM